jgi:hypothetical protein
VRSCCFWCGDCFAICARGKDKTGEVIKSLLHTSTIELEKTFEQSFDHSIERLKLEMDELECSKKEKPEFFVLGGRIITDDPHVNSLKTEKHILSVAKENNIVGIQFNQSFNIMSGSEVYFTSNKIYHSTLPFFSVPLKMVDD